VLISYLYIYRSFRGILHASFIAIAVYRTSASCLHNINVIKHKEDAKKRRGRTRESDDTSDDSAPREKRGRSPSRSDCAPREKRGCSPSTSEHAPPEKQQKKNASSCSPSANELAPPPEKQPERMRLTMFKQPRQVIQNDARTDHKRWSLP